MTVLFLSGLPVSPPVIFHGSVLNDILHVLFQRFAVDDRFQVLAQGNGVSVCVDEESFPGGFQVMHGHGLRLRQVLSVGDLPEFFIGYGLLQVLPVGSCGEELFPGVQHLLLRHCHADVAVVVKAAENRHLIHLLHVCGLQQVQEFSSDSAAERFLLSGQLPQVMEVLQVPAKGIFLRGSHTYAINFVFHMGEQVDSGRNFSQQFFHTEIFGPDCFPDGPAFSFQGLKQINEAHVEVDDAVVGIFRLLLRILAAAEGLSAEKPGDFSCFFVISDKVQDVEVFSA